MRRFALLALGLVTFSSPIPALNEGPCASRVKGNQPLAQFSFPRSGIVARFLYSGTMEYLAGPLGARVHEPEEFESRTGVHAHPLVFAFFSYDGSEIVVLAASGKCRVYETWSGNLIRETQISESEDAIAQQRAIDFLNQVTH